MKVNIDKKIVNIAGFLFLGTLIGLLTYNVLRKGIYSNKMGINVAIVGNNSMSLMLLRPDEELISWIDIPDNLKVRIYDSTATYPILSLWQYSASEKKPFEVFEKSMSTTLGVAVSRVIRVDGEANVETVLGSLHKLGLKTDISLRDRWAIRKFVSDSVESKRVIEESMPKKIFDEVVEADGKSFLTVNSVSSLWTNSKFVLEPILSENAEVVVNNLTGIGGYGIAVSKQIESAGMRVVEVKADPEDDMAGEGCIFSNTDNFPISERFLIDQISCHKISDSKLTGGRKGIVVWLK